MQLKDKWRNLIKFQHLRRGEIESAPYKATVRAKQNAAAAAAKGISGKTKATKSGGASGKQPARERNEMRQIKVVTPRKIKGRRTPQAAEASKKERITTTTTT